MPLFTRDDISRSSIPVSGSGASLTRGTVSFWDRFQKKIDDHFRDMDLTAESSIHFYSDGAWNMHDLLYYFLKRQGAAKVYLTTWAISEIVMRQLCNFMKDGLITELFALFDYRNTSRKPAELAFIEQNATRIKLAKCHAKVTVIDSESMPVTIVSSANYTRNPRLEAGVIAFSREVADFHKEWILKEICDAES